MKKREIVGLGLIAFPFVGLPAALSGYAIMSFVINQLVIADEGSWPVLEVIGRIVNLLLGLLGVASVLGFFIAIPIGIYLVAIPKKSKVK